MKKYLLPLMILGLLPAFGQHQEDKAHVSQASEHLAGVPTPINPTAPKIEFKESQFDFGTIKEGPEAKHEFVFTNTGKEPLVIQNCQPSCGCTAPQCPKEPILPGQTGKITVVYSTSGRVGPFNKSITITSNAGESPYLIYIKGHVKETPPEKTMPVNEDASIMFGQ